MRREMAALSGKSGKKRLPSERVPDTSLAKMNRRQARRRSKAKGSSNERVVAKMFEAWCGWKVKRTPQSGGWSTAAFGVTGDLVCEDKRFPFHVECKKREDWQLDDLVTGVRVKDERSILEWWKQTIRTCPKNKEPLLVFTRNNKAQLVMVRSFWFSDFRDPDANEVPKFVITLQDLPVPDTVSIMRLDLFLAALPPPKRKEKRK